MLRPFMKTLSKLGIKRDFLNLIKGIYEKSTANMLLLLLLLSRFNRVRLCEPNRLPRPWDSPDKNAGVGCHFLLQCMKVKSEIEVTQPCSTLATPWTAAHQASPSMGFSRQKYWSGVPLPSLKLRHHHFIVVSMHYHQLRVFKTLEHFIRNRSLSRRLRLSL